MSLSVYTLIGAALLVLAGPSDAKKCGLVECPHIPDFPGISQTDCCSYSPNDKLCCFDTLDSTYLAGWAIGVIVTGCILIVGGIILCCLCCACCPLVRYRQRKQLAIVTTATYPSSGPVTPAYPPCVATTTTVTATRA
eukprot:scpid104405/ scgid24078/ 